MDGGPRPLALAFASRARGLECHIIGHLAERIGGAIEDDNQAA
jgi:hypothetical protein